MFRLSVNPAWFGFQYEGPNHSDQCHSLMICTVLSFAPTILTRVHTGNGWFAVFWIRETVTERAWLCVDRSKRPYTAISSRSLDPRNAYILFNELHEMTIQMLQISSMFHLICWSTISENKCIKKKIKRNYRRELLFVGITGISFFLSFFRS